METHRVYAPFVIISSSEWMDAQIKCSRRWCRDQLLSCTVGDVPWLCFFTPHSISLSYNHRWEWIASLSLLRQWLIDDWYCILNFRKIGKAASSYWASSSSDLGLIFLFITHKSWHTIQECQNWSCIRGSFLYISTYLSILLLFILDSSSYTSDKNVMVEWSVKEVFFRVSTFSKAFPVDTTPLH